MATFKYYLTWSYISIAQLEFLMRSNLLNVLGKKIKRCFDANNEYNLIMI